VSENRTLLREHCLHGTRTLKYVIASHKSLVNVPINRNLINAYQKSHSAYMIALDEAKQQKTSAALLGKGQLPIVDGNKSNEREKEEIRR